MDTEDRDHFRTLAVRPPQPIGSSKRPNAENLQSPPSPTLLVLAKNILGCYRKNDAADPDVYVAAVAAVLSDYPHFVSESVADPRGGIASSCKFLPSVAEIREACEHKIKLAREDADRQARIDRQLAEREAEDNLRGQNRNLSYAELKEKYGDGKGGWLGEGRVSERDRIYTEEEKAAFLERAREFGARMTEQLQAGELVLSEEARTGGYYNSTGLEP